MTQVVEHLPSKPRSRVPTPVLLKIIIIAWYQWLMPVILATQEAEIRRIKFQSHPQANSSGDPILRNPLHKKGLVEWVMV
jgi:hypothetical protein